MDKPFFSIIIPTYNRKTLLKIAVDSVLRQSFEDWELLVIDDGSTDATQQDIKKVKDRRLRYIRKKHSGVSAARNTGIRAARGEFICFLDSDDRFRTRKLEYTNSFIRRFPKYRIFHTEELWYRNGAILAHKKHHQKPEGMVFAQALKLCCISISTAALHASVFLQVGLFNERLPACEDYDFWLKATARFPVKLIPHVLTIKEGGHRDQQSKKFEAMDTFRIGAIKTILESKTLNPEQRGQAIEELRRKCAIYITGAQKRGNIKGIKRYADLLKRFTVDEKYA